MTIEEAREQLKDLIRDRESFIVGDDDEIYRKDLKSRCRERLLEAYTM